MSLWDFWYELWLASWVITKCLKIRGLAAFPIQLFTPKPRTRQTAHAALLSTSMGVWSVCYTESCTVCVLQVFMCPLDDFFTS